MAGDPMKPVRPAQRTLYAVVAMILATFGIGVTFTLGFKIDPMWAIVAFVLVFDPNWDKAASAGLSRLLVTLLGCAWAVAAIYVAGLHRWLLPLALGMAVWFCGAVLKFSGAWRTLLVCVALVIGTSLDGTDSPVQISLQRSLEVATGSAVAIFFSWIWERLERRR